LIDREGNACLGDFGIVDVIVGLWGYRFRLETARYMAPERFGDYNLASKASDVHSFAMTSFMVRPYPVGNPGDT